SMTAIVGQEASYQSGATNFPSSYGFSWVSTAPGTTTFSSSTGLFRITPTLAGNFSFQVWAANSQGTGSPSNVALTVYAPPVITAIPNQTTPVNQTYSYTVSSSGNPTTLVGTGLPAGVTVNPSTSTIGG